MDRPSDTRSTLVLLALACAASAGGCKQYDSPSTQTSPPAETSNPSTTSQAAGTPAAVQSDQSGSDIGVANSADHGKYLVDATGKTLYALEKDGKGKSSCYDACSTRWPPLLSPQGSAKALDASVKGEAIVSIQRTDGTVQVTYRGHPLYHYSQDQAAGQINGQGIKDQFGEWYLLSPAGEPIESH